MRVVYFLILLFCCSSCKYFTSDVCNNQPLDTIINFKKVDVSPSFNECKELIDEAKTNCFRTTIHQKIANSLAEFTLEVKDSVDEVVMVDLLIPSNGKIQLEHIESSLVIKEQLPQLDSLLKISVEKLPKVFPAIKRDIPVATQYQLPIHIVLQD